VSPLELLLLTFSFISSSPSSEIRRLASNTPLQAFESAKEYTSMQVRSMQCSYCALLVGVLPFNISITPC
jgi:hypothetical protein